MTELKSMSLRMWVRFRFFWTRKRCDEGLAEPLESKLSTTTSDSVRYPAFETYHSKAEATSKMEKRKQSLGVLPKSAVAKAWEASQARKGLSQMQSAVESQ